MGNRFASGKIAIAECDMCGFRYKLKDLKKLVVKTKLVNIKVCPQCWVPDQPQLQLGMYPVEDPQALREPRKDLSYYQSGTNAGGYPSEGSRIFQWGWAPVGGSRAFDDPLTPNYLVATTYVGTVTITTS
jgi:hypothetical protein